MQSICAVEGVTAWGVKEGKYGLALIKASGTGAAVFTSNKVRAPVVNLMAERIKRGKLAGIIVNSGCANAYTGKRGYEDAVTMASIGAEALGISEKETGVASTGVIGRYLDLDLIRRQSADVAGKLAHSADAEKAAAAAIMTTDTVQKHALVQREGFTVAGICKGSGMIAPNMGTMLSFVYTDAEVSAEYLHDALKSAVRRSLNRVVVDGDESTNDSLFCTATGEAGRVPKKEFAAALEECCVSLAKQIAADGEGATKLLEVRVKGARREKDAEKIARAVITSPLVKSAVYGEDPNWGRVVCAVGYSGVEFDIDELSLSIGEGESETSLVRKGEITADLTKAKAAMTGKHVVFTITLESGKKEATAWGCDLTEQYVEINGKYTT
ncbi:MAG TPA: bifunctional ornithine acetyltransferase/N-acetylglutamate synthase [Methanocorpusculum sp.]|nr:bifunctional ornithine acetyltransferase/N-acetylglutamate synthase [Methanocorpusculum sp.]HJK39831.1 bifunctional ornithine acetyltransferase/N-acetylglutamate synthase [Methanocorpusculum sp.]HJK44846.1 bifunctional ornithine acetyltransferase/N-acetylglutamate synthase [Methanocorpusculum sp.]HJK45987.1 bifunctional ornithine acetyltransferase/N-acetylglutamate synthase [Methanocorpusculum sp.]HJK53341.1 bifunctional ornithine acetyltransferase/N-acetylglutamate synthase [Methanocorpuscu